MGEKLVPTDIKEKLLTVDDKPKKKKKKKKKKLKQRCVGLLVQVEIWSKVHRSTGKNKNIYHTLKKCKIP